MKSRKVSGTKKTPAGKVSLRTGIRVTVESFILAVLFHQSVYGSRCYTFTL